MPFCTTDPNLRNDWLTVGSAAQLRGTDSEHPVTTRLLGNDLLLWQDADGAPHCSADGRAMPIRQCYGYLWVLAGDDTAPALFDLPEYAQPGRRIVDCGGIGVAQQKRELVAAGARDLVGLTQAAADALAGIA